MPELKANEEQLLAIRHRFGAMLVLAGPGSGKTFVISQRIKYLIEEYHTDPGQIYVITFTKAAALEMQQRFRRIAGQPYPVHFGTFHSIFFHILKLTYHYQTDNIITEKEKHQYLNRILASHLPGDEIQPDVTASLLSQISRRKNGQELDTDETAFLGQETFETIYKEYRDCLRRNRKLDFDDMVLLCGALFTERPDILDLWQKRVRFLLIDEVQDINAMQYRVVKMLAAPENNLFIVGDDDQSIYGFRGAKPDFIIGFEKDYPGAGKILLPYNYRCGQGIVRASLAVIGENTVRIAKEIKAAGEEEGRVVLTALENREKEYEYLIGQLREKSPEQLRQSAMIFRTNGRMQAAAGELLKAGIDFQMKEKLRSPFRQDTVLDILAYLKFSQGPPLRRDFLRVMNRPCRYLERSALGEEKISFESLYSFYSHSDEMLLRLRQLETDIHRLASMEPYAAVNYIRRGMGYDCYLSGKCRKEILLEQAEWFQQFVKPYRSVAQVFEIISEYKERAGGQEGKGIHLMTMHASKGLEFDTVFLPCLNEGVIPHKKSVTKEQIEEERRMLYVGMTRARRELILSYASGGDTEKPETMSRFLQPVLNYLSSSESSNSCLSRNSSKASATNSYSSSSSINSSSGSLSGSFSSSE